MRVEALAQQLTRRSDLCRTRDKSFWWFPLEYFGYVRCNSGGEWRVRLQTNVVGLGSCGPQSEQHGELRRV